MAQRRLTLVVAAAAALAAASPMVYAATGSPPVTHPDAVTIRAGENVQLDLTDNDGDAEGDSLAVCRLGTDLPKKLSHSYITGGELMVESSPSARGTYTFTYYACDQSYLTAGTVTVTVKPPRPELRIIPVDGAPPGRIRLVNTFKNQTFRCVWHPLDSSKVEGRVTVPPQSAVVIEVHEAELMLECESANASIGATFLRS